MTDEEFEDEEFEQENKYKQDIEELERRIKTLINDDKKMALMSKNSLIKISEYNFENMAKNHIDNLINKEGKK